MATLAADRRVRQLPTGARLRGAVLGRAVAPPLVPHALAGVDDVPESLKARAVQVCGSDARRLCPGSLFDGIEAAHCPSTKRSQLAPACQRAYDEIAHALAR